MAAHPKFADISDAINAGLENLNKWYRKIDDTDIYFICLGACTVHSIFDMTTIKYMTYAALDPKWKLVYAHKKWESSYFNAGVRQLKEVVRCFIELLAHS